jgi:hypothetical protein
MVGENRVDLGSGHLAVEKHRRRKPVQAIP